MESSEVLSRRTKESHVDTVLYEIDMLDFCKRLLAEKKWTTTEHCYLLIEGFLLHYRNLANLFANRDGMKARNARVWAEKNLSDAELASIQDDKPYDDYSGKISQYLSHCTERRTGDVSWNRVEMYDVIKPCIENFRKLFPSSPAPPLVVEMLSAENMSTATTSISHDGLIIDKKIKPAE